MTTSSYWIYCIPILAKSLSMAKRCLHLGSAMPTLGFCNGLFAALLLANTACYIGYKSQFVAFPFWPCHCCGLQMSKMWDPSPLGGKWNTPWNALWTSKRGWQSRGEISGFQFCHKENEHNPDPNCLVIFISSLWLAAMTLWITHAARWLS